MLSLCVLLSLSLSSTIIIVKATQAATRDAAAKKEVVRVANASAATCAQEVWVGVCVWEGVQTVEVLEVART